jgi:hypothetical protein
VFAACAASSSEETTLSGLAVGTRYYFRFRAKVGKVLGDWSQVISVIVV